MQSGSMGDNHAYWLHHAILSWTLRCGSPFDKDQLTHYHRKWDCWWRHCGITACLHIPAWDSFNTETKLSLDKVINWLPSITFSAKIICISQNSIKVKILYIIYFIAGVCKLCGGINYMRKYGASPCIKSSLRLQIHSLRVGCILTSALPSPPSDSCREEWHLKHTSLRLKLCAAHWNKF